jgi:hypothetical protein
MHCGERHTETYCAIREQDVLDAGIDGAEIRRREANALGLGNLEEELVWDRVRAQPPMARTLPTRSKNRGFSSISKRSHRTRAATPTPALVC